MIQYDRKNTLVIFLKCLFTQARKRSRSCPSGSFSKAWRLGATNRSLKRAGTGEGRLLVFWDNVAWVYDIFANVINRKANRALCEAVGKLIIPTYMNQMDRGTANSVSGVIGKAGAGFKRGVHAGDIQTLFADAGYADTSYVLCEGRIPCAVAVLGKAWGTEES